MDVDVQDEIAKIRNVERTTYPVEEVLGWVIDVEDSAEE